MITQRPTLNMYPISDSRTFRKLGSNLEWDYPKFINALNEYINELEAKLSNHIREATKMIQTTTCERKEHYKCFESHGICDSKECGKSKIQIILMHCSNCLYNGSETKCEMCHDFKYWELNPAPITAEAVLADVVGFPFRAGNLPKILSIDQTIAAMKQYHDLNSKP